MGPHRPAATGERRRGQRLHRGSDVQVVLRTGSSATGEYVVVRARARGDGAPARWTVVAGRRVGSAVYRNRAKRRARAAVQASALPGGVDLVFVVRPGALSAPFGRLRDDVSRGIGRALQREGAKA